MSQVNLALHIEDICKGVNSEQIFFDRNYFEVLLSQQKLGTFLENKMLQKLKFSKNVNTEDTGHSTKGVSGYKLSVDFFVKNTKRL